MNITLVNIHWKLSQDLSLNENLTDDIELLGVDRFTLEIVLRQELCLKFGNQRNG